MVTDVVLVTIHPSIPRSERDGSSLMRAQGLAWTSSCSMYLISAVHVNYGHVECVVTL